ncbi:hypothetical protein B0H19DRAFT_1129077 [Mycena capillaripes]|nr:hypothetical protein B0H19DRAFT_1129077 [Mycena capillaripes]
MHPAIGRAFFPSEEVSEPAPSDQNGIIPETCNAGGHHWTSILNKPSIYQKI